MIGMARKKRRGTVKLLRKHGARETMRHGKAPERQTQIGFLAQFRVETVRPADDENRIARALFLPAAEQGGEFVADHRSPLFVQQGDASGCRYALADLGGFGNLARIGRRGAAFKDFGDATASEAQS